jgi:hypothetical protein
MKSSLVATCSMTGRLVHAVPRPLRSGGDQEGTGRVKAMTAEAPSLPLSSLSRRILRGLKPRRFAYATCSNDTQVLTSSNSSTTVRLPRLKSLGFRMPQTCLKVELRLRLFQGRGSRGCEKKLSHKLHRQCAICPSTAAAPQQIPPPQRSHLIPS